MTVEGTVIQGAIVLDQPGTLPEGERVTVTVQSHPAPGETLSDLLMRYAGCMHDLPPDMAEQHDHYVHGTQKR